MQSAHGRIVKCDRGQELGDHRQNRKLSALIGVEREGIADVCPIHSGDPERMELREFFCPGCMTLLEAASPGFPIVFDFLTDLEALYRDWLGRPLPADPSA
ncbi:acetone carboxylase subunit gamma [Sciscionella marina]|uniref:acetone carboxylase subunit gamma n=1 Tax=Sciscionella marina TaxID=508770 RepID=UPI000379E58C|nr:acetone carboxylase subunit gamma [Sciscionella marina]